jgi:hypothetical protein
MDAAKARMILEKRAYQTRFPFLFRPGVWIITPWLGEAISDNRLQATLGVAWWGLVALFVVGAVRYAAVIVSAFWQCRQARKALRGAIPALVPPGTGSF